MLKGWAMESELRAQTFANDILVGSADAEAVAMMPRKVNQHC